MTEDEREQAYMDGSRAAWLSIFNEALRHLGMDDPQVKAAAYLEERVATIAYLRMECAEYGDNDWTDDLYIPNIIEKHFLRPLMSGMPDDEEVSSP